MKKTFARAVIGGAAFLLAANYMLSSGRAPARAGCCLPLALSAVAGVTSAPVSTNAPAQAGALPRLVDLGADKCIPCKLMAPILKDLKKDFEGQLQVDFIDVWKKPEASKAYKINLIPTQIFYDAAGQELFRHEGFLSKEDILAKWKELGVNLKAKTPKSKS
jgi:thioredoxin 1